MLWGSRGRTSARTAGTAGSKKGQSEVSEEQSEMNAFGGLQPCHEEGVLHLDRRCRNAEVFLFKNASAFLPRREQRVSAFYCARRSNVYGKK